MKEKKWKTTFLQMMGLVITQCTIMGGNPLGIAYFSVLYGMNAMRWVSFLILSIGLCYSMPAVNFMKYLLAMVMIVSLNGLYELKNRQKNYYLYGIFAAIGVTAMEWSEVFMAPVRDFRQLMVGLGMGILTFSMTVIFSIGMEAFVNRERHGVYTGEEMISIGMIVGSCLYCMAGKNLPYAIVETAVYVAILYFGYKYGAGIGAIVGAACGIAICMNYENMEMLGCLCVLGILSGAFRQLGKIGSALGFALGTVTLGILGSPMLLTTTWMQGLAAGCLLFLILPHTILYRYDKGNGQEPEQPKETTNKRQLQLIARALQNLSFSFYQLPKENVLKETEDSAKDGDTSGRWEKICNQRFIESREAVALQLKETAGVLEDCAKEVYDIVKLDTGQIESIHRKLQANRIQMKKIVVLENRHHLKDIIITVRAEKGACLPTRELAELLTEVLEHPFRIRKENNTVLGSEYVTINLTEDTNFYVMHGSVKRVKGKESISGDNFVFSQLDSGQTVMSLSDGMGSGLEASQESEQIIELLQQLLESGFTQKAALKLINSAMTLNPSEQNPATLDMGILDLYSGVCDFVKLGAASTFVKRGSWVEVIKSTSMPMGVLGNIDFDRTSKKMYDGDYIVMVSDGILDALDAENKEQTMSSIIMDADSKNPRELARAILKKAMKQSKQEIDDDMTVLVTGIWQKPMNRTA